MVITASQCGRCGLRDTVVLKRQLVAGLATPNKHRYILFTYYAVYPNST